MLKAEEFEGTILYIYGNLYGRTDKDGNRRPSILNKQEAFVDAQAAYNALTDGHQQNEEALLITDQLSHEVVTIMWDLGVSLNDSDPLLNKMWLWEYNAMDSDLGAKYTNPYYQSLNSVTELAVKDLFSVCKKFTKKGIIKQSAIKARNQRINMVLA